MVESWSCFLEVKKQIDEIVLSKLRICYSLFLISSEKTIVVPTTLLPLDSKIYDLFGGGGTLSLLVCSKLV